MWQPCRSRSCCAWPACWVATIRSRSLGVGKLAVQGARERELANIYRGNDAARKLDDEDFAEVLSFTRRAFEMAVGFRGAAGNRRPR